MANLTSQLILTLVDRATAPARGIAKSMDDMRGRIAQNNQQMDAMRGQLIGAAAAGVALYKGLQAPIAAAADFQAEMSNVSTLVDSATESMEDMGRDVLEVSRRVPVALNDLTGSLYSIRSAGVGADAAMSVLEGSARLAVAGLGSTSEATDLVTSAINAFGLEGEAAENIYDQIFKAVKNGKTDISQLAQGFGAVAGTVANAGIEIDEYLASVAAMTTTGLPAAQAHTQIRAAISGLTRETNQSRKVFASLGADNFQDLIEKSGGMVEAFSRIREATGNNDAEMIRLVGSVEAFNAIIALTDGVNETFVETLDDMRNGANAVDEAFEKQNQTFAAMRKRWANMVQGILIPIGNALIPAFEAVQNAIMPMLETIGELATKYPGLTRAIIGVTAALIAFRVASIAARFSFLWIKGGMLTAALGGMRMASVLMALLNPLKLVRGAMILLRTAFMLTGIGAVIAAVAAGGYWIYKNWSNIGNAFDGFRKSFKKAIEPVAGLIEPVVEYFGELYEWVTSLFDPVDDVTGAFENFGSRVGTSVGNAIRGVINFFRDFPRSMAALPGQIMAWLSGIDWGSIGRRAIDLLKQALAGAIAALSLGSDLYRWLADSISEIDFGALGKGFANLVVRAVRSGFGLIRTAFQSLGTSEGRGELAQALGDFLASTGNLIGEIIKGLFNFGVGFWKAVWDECFAGTAAQLSEKAGEIFQDFVDGAIAKVQELIAWFKGLPGRIREAIGSIEIGNMFSADPPRGDSRRRRGGAAAVLDSVGRGAGASDAIDGARAAGGPITAGRTYLVGEEGAELITPSRSGYVHDAATTARMGGASNGTGSGVAVNFGPGSIVVSGISDPAAAAEEVLRQAGAMLRRELGGAHADLEYAPGM